MQMYFIIWLIIAIIWGIIWGVATNAVLSGKNYDDNWFWLGFFFGFIPFIVACTKPTNYYETDSSSSIHSYT